MSGQQVAEQQQKAAHEISDTISVSTKRNANFYVFIGKESLKNHEVVSFHALGNAVSTAVIATENLVRNEYAEFVSIQTQTTTLNDEQKKEQKGQKKKAKLIVQLKKGQHFWDNIEKFNKVREENQKKQAENTNQ